MSKKGVLKGDTDKVKFADKAALRRIVEAQNGRLGIVFDPTATPEKAQQMENVRAEDCIFSQAIKEAREE